MTVGNPGRDVQLAIRNTNQSLRLRQGDQNHSEKIVDGVGMWWQRKSLQKEKRVGEQIMRKTCSEWARGKMEP